MEDKKVNPYIIALTVMLPTFMVLMDTSIVTVALSYMAGPLSVTTDDATWTLTVYLAASGIILPITGFLGNKFGRKNYFLISIIGFTVSSFLCGIAPTLDLLLLFRAIQGFAGGGLQPISQAILMESFPLEKRAQAMSIFSIGVIFAPILGPVIGGWIVDSYSWRWMFLINVPFGILATIMTLMFIFDPPYAKANKTLKLDYVALSFIAIGIGALQVMLDRGQEDDWFNSNFIVILALLSFFFISMFLIKNYFSDKPIIRMSLLKDRNYAIATLAMFFLGFLFFVTLTLLPELMQTLMNYDAYKSGLIMMPGGIASLITVIFIGRVSKKIGFKTLIIFGVIIGLYALYLMEQINLTASPYFLLLGRVLIGFGLPLIFIPINVVAFIFLKNEDMGEASGVLNFARSIGGSFGISLMASTMLAHREALHRDALVSNITFSNPIFQNYLHTLSSYLFTYGGFNPAIAYNKAIGLINNTINAQSTIMAFQDDFHLMMCIILVFLIFLPFIKTKTQKPQKIIISEM
ncbi:DHA2 family efflux MFS transporter permease subunit [Desulfurella sp.]|uniref:DHA2 family efflux MFS transporter permease subunit n=1 Tax=Desulfurella sp. TaxID=1962857 RepID=UPI0025C439A5|nr:DHA2 family efflux MFS transporter permease subunit [Desulfurella sp.]